MAFELEGIRIEYIRTANFKGECKMMGFQLEGNKLHNCIILLCLTVSISGCTDMIEASRKWHLQQEEAKREQQELARQAYIERLQNTCLEFGFTPGKEASAKCVQRLHEQNLAAEQAQRQQAAYQQQQVAIQRQKQLEVQREKDRAMLQSLGGEKVKCQSRVSGSTVYTDCQSSGDDLLQLYDTMTR